MTIKKVLDVKLMLSGSNDFSIMKHFNILCSRNLDFIKYFTKVHQYLNINMYVMYFIEGSTYSFRRWWLTK